MNGNALNADVVSLFQNIGLDIRQLGGLIGDYRYSDQEQYREIENADFGVQMGSGTRPGFTVKADRVSLTGAPGMICISQILIEGTAILRNMTLVCSDNTPAIVIAAGGRCVLQGCHILKASGISAAANNYVEVADGGLLNVVGCMFHGAQSAGHVVTNAGAAANVDITGCVNITGIGHNNVTTVGEVP